MAVEFQCEHCDALLSAEAEAGAEVECPHCGQAAVVPEGLAALPSPQVPGQSPPPVPTDQAAADAPADEPSPEATDENGEPLDEEEEDEEHHEPSAMMKWLSDSVPWVISLFATLTVFLILWFINMLVIYGKPEDVPVPDIVQSQQPGGSISPADMATSDRSRTVRPTPTRKFSKKESPTVDSGKTSDAVELIAPLYQGHRLSSAEKQGLEHNTLLRVQAAEREALAAMGKIHPFFRRAGMRLVGLFKGPTQYYQYYISIRPDQG
ncbi:hypothetical protein LCGC14_0486300 [marine sediment metagenome]|uniref:Uncharacterized protein n=1 Tax=marine sediment metagenome TaxID=412755 RepID=A0A0F9SD25_9ZZZZ